MSDSERPIFSGGISVPVVAGANGGFKLATGDDYITQLIEVNSADADSDNPFQIVGIGQGAVFQNVSDQAWKGLKKREMAEIFRDLKRANLATLQSIRFTDGEVAGDFEMQVTYLSLETNTRRDVNTTLRRG